MLLSRLQLVLHAILSTRMILNLRENRLELDSTPDTLHSVVRRSEIELSELRVQYVVS